MQEYYAVSLQQANQVEWSLSPFGRSVVIRSARSSFFSLIERPKVSWYVGFEQLCYLLQLKRRGLIDIEFNK